ncbi:MAG: Mut7-C RNAse domain-containing protein [Candidatus Bipolaricaulia bacterium]
MKKKFIVDAMLGKLAKWLRILGYDTLYFHDIDDHRLIEIASREGRILLTGDRELMCYRWEGERLFVSSDLWQEQLYQAYHAFDLGTEGIFTRCIDCNQPLEQVAKQEVQGEVPTYVYHNQRAFGRCPRCRKIYWQGTHFEKSTRRVEHILNGKTSDNE